MQRCILDSLKKYSVLAFPFWALLGSVNRAGAQSRIYVNEYLNIGVGARGLSMAGAQSATTDGIYANYWNPAGLTALKSGLEVGAMHAEYFSGISQYDYGALAFPLKKNNGVIGISAIRFSTDNIPYTIDYIQPDGSFDDTKLKAISAGDYAFILSYARRLHLFKDTSVNVSFGANAKVIYRNVGSMANAWGLGADAGLQLKYKKWAFGLMAKDITTTYTAWSFHLTDHEKQVFAITENDIPVKSYEVMKPRLNFGAAYFWFKNGKPFQLMTEFDFDMTTDGKRTTIIATNPISIDPKLGIEASYKNTVYLRAGIGNFYRALDNADTLNKRKYLVYQPSVGVGLRLNVFTIDYAFTTLQMQDNPLMSHVVSLKINFDKRSAAVRARETEPDTKNEKEAAAKQI